jgi:hypothetical protein
MAARKNYSSFLSRKFLHQLHAANIIEYDEKGNVIIKENEKFFEEFDKFIRE